MNSDELIEAWRSHVHAERNGYDKGHRIGFIQGLIWGMLGVALIVLVLSEVTL